MPSQRTLQLDQFRPSFSTSDLDSLRQTIASTRLPAETYASRQPKYGVQHAWMKGALAYWQDGFSWQKYEDKINAVDHFTTTVQDDGHDYKIHLLLHESDDPDAIPLLLLHGWPGSAFEFVEVIKLLRESKSPSFHLIAPMEPGYGWSSGPPLDRGFGMYDCARLMDKLMSGLGFADGYAVQGGDIGSGLARILALEHNAKAINVNYLPAVAPPDDAPERHQLKPHEEKALERSDAFQSTGRGYAIEQATRPGTVGIVVGSSPVALLAWLGEKYAEWTDDDLPLDDLLGIATFWWLRDSYPSSIWAYADMQKTGISALHNDPQHRLDKPLGFSSFAKEISSTPEAWASRNANLQWYRYHDKGGHFAAAERPKEFAKDMQDCFAAIYPRA